MNRTDPNPVTEADRPQISAGDTSSATSHDHPTDAARLLATTVAEAARTPRPRLALVVLALITAAAAAAAAWTGLEVQEERTANAQERSALAAGREAAVAFTSYNYKQIDEDLARVSDISTGEFREEFSKALGALTDAIIDARGVSAGTINQLGLVRISDQSAVIIAAVDASVTNKATEKPTLRRYRLQITLTRDDETWLISDINPVA